MSSYSVAAASLLLLSVVSGFSQVCFSDQANCAGLVSCADVESNTDECNTVRTIDKDYYFMLYRDETDSSIEIEVFSDHYCTQTMFNAVPSSSDNIPNGECMGVQVGMIKTYFNVAYLPSVSASTSTSTDSSVELTKTLVTSATTTMPASEISEKIEHSTMAPTEQSTATSTSSSSSTATSDLSMPAPATAVESFERTEIEVESSKTTEETTGKPITSTGAKSGPSSTKIQPSITITMPAISRSTVLATSTQAAQGTETAASSEIALENQSQGNLAGRPTVALSIIFCAFFAHVLL